MLVRVEGLNFGDGVMKRSATRASCSLRLKKNGSLRIIIDYTCDGFVITPVLPRFDG
jgi:hypothetical protein